MYDALIVGAGPAGLTSLLYLTHYGLQALCIGDTIGGKLLPAPDIIDYPGIEEISGSDFISKLIAQLATVKAHYSTDVITEVETMQPFIVSTQSGKKYEAKTVILSLGNIRKQGQRVAKDLLQKLALVESNGLLIADEKNMTSKPGIFAAGDCLAFPKSQEQLVTAVASGMQTASSVYHFLQGKLPPILWGKSKILRFI